MRPGAPTDGSRDRDDEEKRSGLSSIWKLSSVKVDPAPLPRTHPRGAAPLRWNLCPLLCCAAPVFAAHVQLCENQRRFVPGQPCDFGVPDAQHLVFSTRGTLVCRGRHNSADNRAAADVRLGSSEVFWGVQPLTDRGPVVERSSPRGLQSANLVWGRFIALPFP